LIPTSMPSNSPVSTSVPSATITPTFKPTVTPSTGPLSTAIPSIAIVETGKPSVLTLSVSVLPTMLPTTQLTIPIPYFRYIPWSDLNDDTRILAILLGYKPETWDAPGMANIESLSFDMIKNSTESRRITYIEALGYGKSAWDCYITHYRSYNWEMLNQSGVQEYYTTLGWTQQRWSNGDVPNSENLLWMDLNLSERIAAESLCYFEPTWNKANLQDDVAWRSSSLSSVTSGYMPSIPVARSTIVLTLTCLAMIISLADML
jgi:hypothetical protein